MPELVTTIAAPRHGESDLVVGCLFGSNLFNSLAGGAATGLAAGSTTTARAGSVALFTTMIFTAVLAWALLRRRLRLTRPEAVVLLPVWPVCLPLVLVA